MDELKKINGKTYIKIYRKCITRNGTRICKSNGVYAFWVEVK
ncbi:hypothetical protein SAMN05443633_103465 [Chryseobacterium arachidis]|uniref:Uncharacterized protein n=1 Tax=Chryseobacterium arachidis TaxID=1416778 RepID=A0A1M5AEH8_9FLAO|nr:hypothetical protein SAMN05443633_103465 [Chryseobacterium arachidis]